MTRYEIKKLAKEKMNGNLWMLNKISLPIVGIALLFNLVIVLSNLTLEAELLANIVVSLILAPLNYGMYVCYLNFVHGKKFGYREILQEMHHFPKIIVLTLLQQAIITLSTFMFVLPGIIFTIVLSLLPYVYYYQKESSVKTIFLLALDVGFKHFGKIAMLYLSFIGWIFLCIFSAGVAIIYVLPYMNTTLAIFARQVLEDRES